MIPFARPLVLGHRGVPSEATENTLESFALALKNGADGVELDIQRSRDGVPVVIHDDELKRVWGLKGSVSRLAWTAIERLTNARLPSLSQVGAWAAASGAWLNIELKAPGVEGAVLAVVAEMQLRERVVISSFDPEIVRAIGAADSRMRRFLLTERWDDEARHAVDVAGACGVCLQVDAATPAVLDDLRDRTLPVIVWTVNDSARAGELFRAGISGIISDDPEMAARERDALLSL